jgi:hypothetical protein
MATVQEKQAEQRKWDDEMYEIQAHLNRQQYQQSQAPGAQGIGITPPQSARELKELNQQADDLGSGAVADAYRGSKQYRRK